MNNSAHTRHDVRPDGKVEINDSRPEVTTYVFEAKKVEDGEACRHWLYEVSACRCGEGRKITIYSEVATVLLFFSKGKGSYKAMGLKGITPFTDGQQTHVVRTSRYFAEETYIGHSRTHERERGATGCLYGGRVASSVENENRTAEV